MRNEYAILFSMVMPGVGHVYMGKTVKGVILMILAMIGLFVFLMPHAHYQIFWSMQEYIVVAVIWIAAWVFGVADCTRTGKKQSAE